MVGGVGGFAFDGEGVAVVGAGEGLEPRREGFVIAVDGVGDVGEPIGIAVAGEGLEGMESCYACAGVCGCFEHGKGEGAGAVDDVMMGLPRDAVADGIDCGVAGGDEDEVGEFCHFGCVVDYRNVRPMTRQPLAVFWSA